MFVCFIELRAPTGTRLRRMLADVYERNEVLRKHGPELRLSHEYHVAFGPVDLLLVRRFSSLFPFAELPSSPTMSSRRVVGMYQPTADELRKWVTSLELAEFPGIHEQFLGRPDPCPDDPFPFCAVIYLALNRLCAMVPDPVVPSTITRRELVHARLNAAGPARRAVAAIVRADNGLFESILDYRSALPATLEGSPRPPRLQVLLGLDRIPLAVQVSADLLDDIVAITRALRSLSLGLAGRWDRERLKRLIGVPTIDEGHWSRAPLFSDTTTVSGMAVRPGLVRGRHTPFSAPLTRGATEGGHGPWYFDFHRSRASHTAVSCGTFRTDIRVPTWNDHLSAGDIAAALGLAPASEHAWYVGAVDQTLHSTPSGSLEPWSLIRVAELMQRLASDGGSSRIDSDALARGVPEDHKPPLRLDTLHLTTTPVVQVPPNLKVRPHTSELGGLLQQAFIDAAEYHMRSRPSEGDEDAHQGPRHQGLRARWVDAARDAGLGYTATTGGVQLINDLLRYARVDDSTFGELLPATRQMVEWLEALVCHQPDSVKQPAMARRVVELFEAIEQLQASRARRSAPISRSPRVHDTYDVHAAYDISRHAFSAVAHAEATTLGMNHLVIRGTAAGQSRVETFPSKLSVMLVPSHSFLEPYAWVHGHELAHASLYQRTIDSMPSLRGALDEFRDTLLGEVQTNATTIGGIIDAARIRFNTHRVADFTPAFMNALVAAMGEALADLIGSRATCVGHLVAHESPEFMRRHLYLFGPALVLATQHERGRLPPTDDELVALVLRVALLTLVLCYAVSPPNEEPLDVISRALLESIGPLAGPPAGQAPEFKLADHQWYRLLVRDQLVALRWDMGLTETDQFERCVTQAALLGGVESNDEGGRFPFSKAIRTYFRLACIVLRRWSTEPALGGQGETGPERDPGDPDERIALVEYIDDLRRLAARGHGRAPTVEGAPYPWLACLSTAPNAAAKPSEGEVRAEAGKAALPKQADPRLLGPAVPWMSRRGGLRFCDSPSDVSETALGPTYHRRTTQLLLVLARKNRKRQEALIDNFVADTLRQEQSDVTSDGAD